MSKAIAYVLAVIASVVVILLNHLHCSESSQSGFEFDTKQRRRFQVEIMKCDLAILQSSFCPNHRSFPIFFLIFVVNVYTSKAAASEVSCEEVRYCNLKIFFGLQMTCVFNEVTIDSQGFTIASAENDAVTAMGFFRNKNVSFLPVNVYNLFPYLVTMSASSGSIKTISKENFKHLKKLRGLYLDKNQIKTIRTNVFEDLTSLERLDLG